MFEGAVVRFIQVYGGLAMRNEFGFIPVLFSISINVCLVNTAHALLATYSYQGNNFDKFEGEPETFSTSDRVTAQFTLDCAAAHSEGNCENLPYANYVELGAVELEPLSFSAGPAKLPTSDGKVDITRFSFSTDSKAHIVEWDLDLSLADPSGPINVDTDSVGEGFDSAAALGGSARIAVQPGNWDHDLPVDDTDFDILVIKSVDNSTPSDPQQTVEFTIEVSNIGDGLATDVLVKDKLPTELAIPEGMVAFTSAGYYDPSSGRWELENIAPGSPPEIMTIPVVITSEHQPICIINTASSNMTGDTNSGNNSSFASLRRPSIERCVDLGVKVTSWFQPSGPCGGISAMFYDLRITNAGPDQARKVVLNVAETLYQAPGSRMSAPNCEDLRCTWAEIMAGETKTVSFRTDNFEVQAATKHGIRATVGSDIEDYASEDNSLVDERTIQPVKQDCGGGDWNLDLGGAYGGCFIATATYGSALHPQVQILREFRDNVLLESSWGRSIVDFYYHHSPNLARYIAERDDLRLLARGVLAPIVFAVAYPWWALLAFVTACSLVAAVLLTLYRRS